MFFNLLFILKLMSKLSLEFFFLSSNFNFFLFKFLFIMVLNQALFLMQLILKGLLKLILFVL
jgi:hypothetical protein